MYTPRGEKEGRADRSDGGAARASLPGAGDVLRAPGRYAGLVGRRLRDRMRKGEGRGAALVALAFAALVLAGYAFLLVVMTRVPDVATLERSRGAQATIVYAADGVQLARFYRENRTWVPLDSIAPVAVSALVATEDRRFYDHGGIDVMRTAGAFLRTLGGEPQGGSTITMQLVRNAFPDVADDVTLTRKVKEWLTALRIEGAYTKQQILTTYLNTVPFNYNAFGIEAAARTYFNTSALGLDTLQAATLVGMLKGTTLYNPVRNPEAALARRNVVLDQMVAAGTVAPGKRDQWRDQPTPLSFTPQTTEKNRAPYFAEHVRQWLSKWAEARDLDIYAAGLRVHTTIDAGLQALAEKAVTEELRLMQDVVAVSWSARRVPFVSGDPEAYSRIRNRVEPFAYYWEANPDALDAFLRRTTRYRGLTERGISETEALSQVKADAPFVDSVKTAATRLQGGLVALEPSSGTIRAWVGGGSFEADKYDHVAVAKRQPGSTFKPFVYAAALEAGYSPYDRLRDVRMTYVDPSTKKRWEPGNFGDETGAEMLLSEGLAQSKNTLTAQLIVDVGADRVAALAKKMGIESELDAVPSLGLGTSPVTLLEMVSGYATLVRDGRYVPPSFVTRILDADGNVLATFEAEEGRGALPANTAYTVLDMMRGVIDGGTGTRMRSQYGARGDLAGKTGTTQNAADGWFILMHPHLVIGSWVGFSSPAVTFRTQYWGQGSHNALRLVGHFFREAGLSSSARFQPPPGYAPPRQEGRLLLAGDRAGSDRAGVQREEGLYAAGGSSGERYSGDRPRGSVEGRRDRSPEDDRRAERAGRRVQEERGEGAEEADQLNRRERRKSKVDEYLEKLDKEKKSRGNGKGKKKENEEP